MPRKTPTNSSPALRTVVRKALDATVELMVCCFLCPTMPSVRSDENAEQKRSREFFEAIDGDRTKALRKLIAVRPIVAAQLERQGIDSSPLFEIELLMSWSRHDQAEARARVYDRCYVACARLATIMDSKAPPRSRLSMLPLTEVRQQIWNCLSGTALLSKEIRAKLPMLPSDEAVRKHIQAIRETGREVNFAPGVGYVRPDAPPSAAP